MNPFRRVVPEARKRKEKKIMRAEFELTLLSLDRPTNASGPAPGPATYSIDVRYRTECLTIRSWP